MIRFNCSCGHRMAVDQVHAGRKGTCPRCHRIVRVPEVVQEELALAGVGVRSASHRTHPHAVSARVHTGGNHDGCTRARRCPQCGGPILAGTIKCVHCGMPLCESGTYPALKAARAGDCDLNVRVPASVAAEVSPEYETNWPPVQRDGRDIADLVEPLVHALAWIRGVALVNIIVGGLWSLVGLVILIGGAPRPLAEHGAAVLGVAIGYVGGGAVSIYLGTILYQAAGLIRRSHDLMSRGLLREALKKLCTYFTTLGIIVLIGVLLCIVVGFAGALCG